MPHESTPEQASLTRRNALKAAAAAGVGAAAFAGPQIGVLGSTPAYAQACSAPFDIVDSSDCINTSCNGPNDTVNYNAPSVNPIAGSYMGGTFSATITPGFLGTAAVDLTVSSNIQCRVSVRVYGKNSGGPDGPTECSNDVGNTATTAPPDGPGTDGLTEIVSTAGVSGTTTNLALPSVTCQSGGGSSSIFVKFVVECTTDTDTSCM